MELCDQAPHPQRTVAVIAASFLSASPVHHKNRIVGPPTCGSRHLPPPGGWRPLATTNRHSSWRQVAVASKSPRPAGVAVRRRPGGPTPPAPSGLRWRSVLTHACKILNFGVPTNSAFADQTTPVSVHRSHHCLVPVASFCLVARRNINRPAMWLSLATRMPLFWQREAVQSDGGAKW